MIILGIESSCDDTSVALIDASESGFVVLSEKTASQIDIHKKYGGVVPEIAGRAHAEKILPLVEEVMKGQEKPDVIAVTSGPGLITGLLVGVEAAKSLSYLLDVPLIGINHIEGHIHSVLLNASDEADHDSSSSDGPSRPRFSPSQGETPSGLQAGGEGVSRSRIAFPALCLIVSGGHTELILMKDHGSYKLIGKTRDDAAGEAFDKVAKLLDLDYPGGPKISKLSETGNAQAIPFPRPMMRDENADFSFAGLKTAALYWLRDNQLSPTASADHDSPPAKRETRMSEANGEGVSRRLADPNTKTPITKNDFCASFEQAIVDVLVTKTLNAAKQYNPKTIILAGGVSANKNLRNTLNDKVKEESPMTNVQCPKTTYAMDNAAMIAVAAYFRAQKKQFTTWETLSADPNWKVYA